MSESNTKTAVITAIITGVFTVIAGLATYWVTTKEPELSYTVVGGPTLSVTAGSKRIFVVEVRNSGKKEIQQTYVQLTLNSGELSEVATEASPGVKLIEDKGQKQIALTADMLNPGDLVKISFLTALSSSDSEPRVVVRAPGVKAIDVSAGKSDLLDQKFKRLSLLLIPALAAVLTSFLLLFRKSPFAQIPNFASALVRLHQSEMAAFICCSCQLQEEADLLRFGGSEVTFRGTADYLLQRAKKAKATDQYKYIVALKALLLSNPLANSSIEIIRHSIEEITGSPIVDAEFISLRERSVDEGEDPLAWRRCIVAYARSELG